MTSTTHPPSPLQRMFLLLLVSITGAVVLALEVLGTRVIGTWYGSSLYVWAALLITTLICLAAGYALGGRLADRFPTLGAMCVLVLAAGVCVWITPFLSIVLEPLDKAFGFVFGSIASALAIFAVPLTLLAMAGPYVIRLLTQRVEGVGRTSGAVYSVSTLGSVAGVLAVSLWMIPSLGTRASLTICSGLLVGVGAIGLMVAWGTRGSFALAVLMLPGLVRTSDPRSADGELYHAESPYGDLRVVERNAPSRGPYRMLLVNGIMQTGMPLDIGLVGRGNILRSDDYHLELLPYFHDGVGAGRHGVLIGLAGGMFPRVMEFYEIDWTAVEIDLRVAEIARAYFGYRGEIHDQDGRPHQIDLSAFPRRQLPAGAVASEDADDVHRTPGEYRGRAVIQDGRRYLEKMPIDRRADYIVLDAYSSDAIPFHLVTREFFDLTRRRLTDDGILAVNYIGRPENDHVTDCLFRTLVAVYGQGCVRAYTSLGPTERQTVQVITVFAFRRPLELTGLSGGGATGGVDRLSFELQRRQLQTDRPGGAVITDDHNPIDLSRAKVALEWRRQTLARLAEMR